MYSQEPVALGAPQQALLELIGTKRYRCSMSDFNDILGPCPEALTPQAILAHPIVLNNLHSHLPQGRYRNYAEKQTICKSVDSVLETLAQVQPEILIWANEYPEGVRSKEEQAIDAPYMHAIYLELRRSGLTHYEVVV